MFTMHWIKQGEKIRVDHPAVLFKVNKREDIFSKDYPIVRVEYIDSRLYDKAILAVDEINLIIENSSFPEKAFLTPEPTQHLKGSLDNGDLRNVYQYVGKNSGLPIRAGLTVHIGNGGWSSTPHSFEKEYILSPKPMQFYEKFGYLTYPKSGWGVQIRTGHLLEDDNYIYGPSSTSDFVNDVCIINDGSIEQIPLGSHPVSAGVGYRLAYLWCYSCEHLDLMEKFDE